MQRKPDLFLVVGLVVGIGLVLGRQYHTTVRLRAEVGRQRLLADERTRLENEHQRSAADQVSPEELERLRAERSAVTGLVAEIEAMKRRAEAAAPAGAAPPSPPAAPNAVVPSLTDSVLPARLWKNAGQTSPEAAFQTALWASAGGDVDVLAGLLSLNDRAKTRAQEIFANLPFALQQEMATPERLIALLTARDVPLGSAQILGQYKAPEETIVSARLTDAEGNARKVLFTLHAEGDRWRLDVPESAVEKYAAMLQAPAAGP